MRRSSRLLVLILSLCLAVGFSVFPFSYALESDDLSGYKGNLEDVRSRLDDAEGRLKKGKAKAGALAKEIKALDNKIYSSEVEINNLEKKINSTKAEITQRLEDLKSKKEEVKNQNDSLNARLRTIYKNGDVGMLSVLLGSKDISEFLTNLDMVQRVYKNDAKVLSALEAQYDDIEGVKNELVSLKDKLETQQADMAAKKTALSADKKAAAGKKSEIDKDNKELEAMIDAMNKEANALTAQILRLQGNSDYIGGKFLWPSAASRYISSPFGMRLHPILHVRKLHTGIDIAARMGTDILAANSGTVIASGWNNSYGFMIMIDHGGGIVTLYAHSSKLLAAKGDIVARGQVIAKVGSTGRATGPHLHFEVRLNGQYQNPLNYVSP